jgi:hypothetical protein
MKFRFIAVAVFWYAWRSTERACAIFFVALLLVALISACCWFVWEFALELFGIKGV